MKEKGTKLVANNKKAYHDYFINEKFEAGLALVGTEVKSLRDGKCSIKEAYIKIDKGEAFILGMNISPYEKGNIFNKDPMRDRKLLLNKLEITRLSVKIKQKGYSLIPISLYFKGDIVKVELGVGKGKKLYDKRADIKAKDLKREAGREFKIKNM